MAQLNWENIRYSGPCGTRGDANCSYIVVASLIFHLTARIVFTLQTGSFHFSLTASCPSPHWSPFSPEYTWVHETSMEKQL